METSDVVIDCLFPNTIHLFLVVWWRSVVGEHLGSLRVFYTLCLWSQLFLEVRISCSLLFVDIRRSQFQLCVGVRISWYQPFVEVRILLYMRSGDPDNNFFLKSGYPDLTYFSWDQDILIWQFCIWPLDILTYQCYLKSGYPDLTYLTCNQEILIPIFVEVRTSWLDIFYFGSGWPDFFFFFC